jgi:hypothetical protein
MIPLSVKWRGKRRSWKRNSIYLEYHVDLPQLQPLLQRVPFLLLRKGLAVCTLKERYPSLLRRVVAVFAPRVVEPDVDFLAIVLFRQGQAGCRWAKGERSV